MNNLSVGIFNLNQIDDHTIRVSLSGEHPLPWYVDLKPNDFGELCAIDFLEITNQHGVILSIPLLKHFAHGLMNSIDVAAHLNSHGNPVLYHDPNFTVFGKEFDMFKGQLSLVGNVDDNLVCFKKDVKLFHEDLDKKMTALYLSKEIKNRKELLKLSQEMAGATFVGIDLETSDSESVVMMFIKDGITFKLTWGLETDISDDLVVSFKVSDL
jgi:hypothetical protein